MRCRLLQRHLLKNSENLWQLLFRQSCSPFLAPESSRSPIHRYNTNCSISRTNWRTDLIDDCVSKWFSLHPTPQDLIMDLAARTEEFLGGFAHRWCLQFPVYHTYRSLYFNCWSPFSIPKRKNTFVEPTRSFFRLQISPALVGCSLFSFRTVNRGKQLKITLYMSYNLILFWLCPQQWDGRGLSELGAGGSARDLRAGLTDNVSAA